MAGKCIKYIEHIYDFRSKQFYNFEALQNLYDISHVSDMISVAVFVFFRRLVSHLSLHYLQTPYQIFGHTFKHICTRDVFV